MKKFLKSSLSSKSKRGRDRTFLEERWSALYQNSRKTRFYSIVKRELDSLLPSETALEYGSSIGVVSSHLSETCEFVIGVDKSFGALSFAKKSQIQC